MNFIKHVYIAFFLISIISCQAQEVFPSADTSHLDPLVFNLADLQGYRLALDQAEAGNIFDGDTLTRTYVGRSQTWLNSEEPYTPLDPATITLLVFECDTEVDAVRLFEKWSAEVTQERDLTNELPDLGEIVKGDIEQGWLAFTRGNLFISLSIDVGYDAPIPELVAERVALLQSILGLYVPKLPPLEAVHLEISISANDTEIQYGSNENLVVDAAISGLLTTGNPRVRFLLFEESTSYLDATELQAPSPPASQFVLDLGNRVPGEYTVLAEITDNYERSSASELSFLIQANEDAQMLLPHQDTILSIRNQHQNDGANTLLTLEKIQGKATRSAVAFDLASTNLDGLSQATLVLNVDPSEGVNGWGNGRTISAQAITTPWLEGNGMNFGLKKKDQDPGTGSGATWFSPNDEDISNDSSNSVVNWNGAGAATYPPTAPAVTISNGLAGEVSFDVTADVLNGADNGWLILKDQENVGSKISFFSREGAAAAGDPDLAPRLILEFGEVASSEPPSDSLLARVGFGAIGTKLRLTSNGSEIRSTKEILQESPVAALAIEQLLFEATRANPVLNLTTRISYRSWLADGLQLAATPFWAA